MIGRQRELAEVSALLGRSHVVTIAGPGGIGKTHLAVEAALHVREAHQDGVWFADLAQVEAELVPSVVAAAAGVELAPNQDAVAALIAALRPLRTLVVLDNCERVVAQVAQLVEGLEQACPRVRVLATSREPLGLAPESVYRLGPLSQRAAVELFTMHARLADPAFSASGQNAAVVRDICKRLDGVALAIGLAAACVRIMPLGQLRARLDGRFRLMLGEGRAALARHQTVRALIDSSYDLLTDAQQSTFRRLSVFSGAFSKEAANRVVGGSDAELERLVETSMIERDGVGRYRLLESMRRYALQQLADAGEERSVRSAHAAFFAERSAQAAAGFGRGSEEEWLAAHLPDLDNYRAALEFARTNDVQLAAQMSADLADLWEFANLAGEGLRRSEAILAGMRHPNDPSALPLLVATSRLALGARVYRRSYELAQRAGAIAQQCGDAANGAEAKRLKGRSAYLLGIEPGQSLADLRDALAYAREHGSQFAVARALRDYASALAQCDPAQGRLLLEEALELARGLQWPRLTLHIEINVAEREFRSGETNAAIQRVAGAIEVLRRRRSPVQLGHALTNYTAYLSVAGQYEEMFAAAREAIAIGVSHEEPNYVTFTLQSVAVMLADRGQARKAAELLGYVDAFYRRFGMKRELTEEIVHRRLREVLERHLDGEAIERGIRVGSLLSDDAARALAFGS
jgi:predicted ATPase